MLQLQQQQWLPTQHALLHALAVKLHMSLSKHMCTGWSPAAGRSPLLCAHHSQVQCCVPTSRQPPAALLCAHHSQPLAGCALAEASRLTPSGVRCTQGPIQQAEDWITTSLDVMEDPSGMTTIKDMTYIEVSSVQRPPSLLWPTLGVPRHASLHMHAHAHTHMRTRTRIHTHRQPSTLARTHAHTTLGHTVLADEQCAPCHRGFMHRLYGCSVSRCGLSFIEQHAACAGRAGGCVVCMTGMLACCLCTHTNQPLSPSCTGPRATQGPLKQRPELPVWQCSKVAHNRRPGCSHTHTPRMCASFSQSTAIANLVPGRLGSARNPRT